LTYKIIRGYSTM